MDGAWCMQSSAGKGDLFVNVKASKHKYLTCNTKVPLWAGGDHVIRSEAQAAVHRP